MQPLTASEIDLIQRDRDNQANIEETPECDVFRIDTHYLDGLIATARLAPQWRPGSEPPDHDCDVMTTDGILTYAGRTGIGGYGEDRDFVDRPRLWTYLPEPPAAPGEGEKA